MPFDIIFEEESMSLYAGFNMYLFISNNQKKRSLRERSF